MNPNLLDVNENIGNTIRFKTQHVNDAAPITGMLVSVGDVRMAELFSDVALYHVGVEQGRISNGQSALGSHLDFTYIVIEDSNGERTAYAVEWIDVDGYDVLTSTQSVDIRLQNVTQSDVASVLSAIQAMNIPAKVVV